MSKKAQPGDWSGYLSGVGYFSSPNWIVEAGSGLTKNEKLALLYLCRRAGPSGTCFPSIRTAARDLGLSKPTVQKTLKALAAKGHIRIQKQKTGGRNKASIYLLTLRDPRQRVDGQATYPSNPAGRVQPTYPSTDAGGQATCPGGQASYPSMGKPLAQGGQEQDTEVLPTEGTPGEGEPVKGFLVGGSGGEVGQRPTTPREAFLQVHQRQLQQIDEWVLAELVLEHGEDLVIDAILRAGKGGGAATIRDHVERMTAKTKPNPSKKPLKEEKSHARST